MHAIEMEDFRVVKSDAGKINPRLFDKVTYRETAIKYTEILPQTTDLVRFTFVTTGSQV
jgi:hypothetical protein